MNGTVMHTRVTSIVVAALVCLTANALPLKAQQAQSADDQATAPSDPSSAAAESNGSAAQSDPVVDLSDEIADEAQFDDAILEVARLAGHALICSQEDEVTLHEQQAFVLYRTLVELFGTERAFKFAAAYGHAAGEEIESCEGIVDRFEDRYGAAVQRFDIID